MARCTRKTRTRHPIAADSLAVPVREAARLLGISRQAAYDAIEAGTLKTVNLGQRRTIVARAEIARVLAGGAVSAAK